MRQVVCWQVGDGSHSSLGIKLGCANPAGWHTFAQQFPYQDMTVLVLPRRLAQSRNINITTRSMTVSVIGLLPITVAVRHGIRELVNKR